MHLLSLLIIYRYYGRITDDDLEMMEITDIHDRD